MSQNTKPIKLFLVDDDALFLRALDLQFKAHIDFEIETFSTGEACLLNLAKLPDIIILDYHLDSIVSGAMNGLDTLDQIKAAYPLIPVIILSSQDSIEVAIQCMHHKAYDYVVKSETAFLRLQKIITNIFRYNKLEKELNWYMDRI
jgi:two-component system OmpR family response regulator